ncbi:phosphopantothenate--cysteine ligase [Lactococcus termiticola]|uniref:Phosphopantothenate-cysteine ligase n=1 Tax=Lactococcus termiticola TaxID=2169526 RepID=A0A2R5HGV2_9LACT|nr:phosphopantothenate--cysteine ligase [Lactococcus termiticola]GBG97287.1 phosphopantothenate-cysteine ligase [Lactococcus termiticola]
MRVIISSGGTVEKIDEVRGISNFATGSLGCLTAEAYLEAGHEVIYLSAPQAKRPESHNSLKIIDITNVDSLIKAMQAEVPRADVIIHSMAVSDYRPVFMTDLESLPADFPVQKLTELQVKQEKKTASSAEQQIILLEKTPKVIKLIKNWNPKAILVAFKLLVGVSQEELLTVAKAKRDEAQADFILANDLEQISKDQHQAWLIDKSDQMTKLQTKAEIAQALVAQTEEALHG